MNTLYTSAKTHFLKNTMAWETDVLQIALYDNLCVFDDLHTNISELAGTQIAPGQPLINAAVVLGTAASDDTVYTALTNPLTVSVAVIYRPLDGELIAFMDTVLGLPFIPTGGNYAVASSGPNDAWFTL